MNVCKSVCVLQCYPATPTLNRRYFARLIRTICGTQRSAIGQPGSVIARLFAPHATLKLEVRELISGLSYVS